MKFEEKIIGEIRQSGEAKNGQIQCILHRRTIREGLPIFLSEETVKKIDNFTVKNRQLNHVFVLEVGSEQYNVIIRERKRDYKTDRIFHMDLLALYPESKTDMKVEVVFLNKGSSQLEKTNKIALMSSPKFLPVRCIGNETLSTISIDLNEVQPDSKIYASNLPWPNNIKYDCEIHNDRLVLKAATKKVVEKATGKEKGKKKK